MTATAKAQKKEAEVVSELYRYFLGQRFVDKYGHEQPISLEEHPCCSSL